MSIISLLILLLVMCLIIWLVRSYMPAPFNPIVIWVVVGIVIIILLWWLLGGAGISLNTPLRIR